MENDVTRQEPGSEQEERRFGPQKVDFRSGSDKAGSCHGR